MLLYVFKSKPLSLVQGQTIGKEGEGEEKAEVKREGDEEGEAPSCLEAMSPNILVLIILSMLVKIV